MTATISIRDDDGAIRFGYSGPVSSYEVETVAAGLYRITVEAETAARQALRAPGRERPPMDESAEALRMP